MILTKNVEIKVAPTNYTRLIELGYEVDIDDIVEILVDELTKGSHTKILVKCDECGIEKEVEYQSLYKNNYLKYYKCKKCKSKENNIKKYGVENVFQLDSIKEKSKKTILTKYGVNNVSKSKIIQQQKIETNLEKYGVEWSMMSLEIQEKSKKTNLDRYGVDNISKLKEVKQQKVETCLKNNGVEYISQSHEFKGLIKNNNIIKLSKKYNLKFVDINDEYFFIYCDVCNKVYPINKKAFYTRCNCKTIICSFCNPVTKNFSGLEKQLLVFVEENYDGKIILNSNKIIKPFELDIYLPEINLALEFNGLYWHSEEYRNKDYHLNKTKKCLKLGIQLIHVWEDDWRDKKEIIKSIILNKLGKTTKIYARNCEIREVDSYTVKDFLNINHLQGFIGSKYKIGLYYKDELVSLMTFGNLRLSLNKKTKDVYELLRFSDKNNITIIGGANKLLKYFENIYNPSEIITYANRCWCVSDLYKKMYFEFIRESDPEYYYIINNTRKHRFNYRKNRLVKEGFDPDKTEHEIMIERNIHRIYDAGQLKFRKLY